MSKYYQIWNRTDSVITPIYEILTPEEWMTRYPAAAVEALVPVVAAGEINGGFFGTLNEMARRAANEGCDFTGCETNEQILDRIEEFEDERRAKAEAAAKERQEAEAANAYVSAEALASISASMEYQNLLTLEDAEV